jgi:hypothetical protein
MKWYPSSTGTDQGLVIEETTGDNIAVTYKAENAPIVALAPEAIDLLREIEDLMWEDRNSPIFSMGTDRPIRRKIEDLLSRLLRKEEVVNNFWDWEDEDE